MPAPQATVTVSSKGWVVIPAFFRKKINLKPGTKMLVNEVDGKIVLEPQPENPVNLMFGKLAGGASLTQELLAEKREEKSREEGKIRS